MERFLGIDLSKKSTGVSIVDIDNKNLKIVDNYSIRHKKALSFNKLYFYIKDVLIGKLEKIFRSQRCKFSVAFEFMIFSDYTSELQFYLTQELLKLCYKYNINAVGYSPSFLKKFVKLFVRDGKKYSPHLHKDEIREIYENYIYPINKAVLPESKLITDDDSMDALLLGILGGILQNSISNLVISQLKMTMQNILNHEFDNLLLINSNYYRELYLDRVYNLKLNNFNFNSTGEEFKKQFKGLIKDSLNNDHLTLRSKMFFPFEIVSELKEKMRRFRIEKPDEFYTFWTKYLGTRKGLLLSNVSKSKDFDILFNKRGSYFLYQRR